MSLFLQTGNELSQDVYWIIGAAIVLAIVFFMTKRAQYRQRNRAIGRKKADPRSQVVNDSNYNINREGIDGHRTENLDAGKAEKAIDTLEDTEQLPSEEEFNTLRKNTKS